MQATQVLDGVKILELKENIDQRGCLCFAEAGVHVPFEIKRTFWIYKTPEGIARGHHAHRESHQAHVCLHGSAAITLDNGQNKKEIVLDRPNKVLILESMIWHSFRLRRGSLLFVFTSDKYDPKDYVRDYNEFLRLVRRGPK